MASHSPPRLQTRPQPTLQLLASLLVGGPWPPAPLWPAICQQAVQHGLAPLLYDQLRNNGNLANLPAAAQAQLLEAYGQAAGYHFLALEQAWAWAERFATAGITAVWFKGVPLSLTLYPRPETRPMTDIDVLVSHEQLPQALALVERVSGSRPVMFNPQRAIHAVFNLGPAALVKMELHWNLIDVPGAMLSPNPDWFLGQQMVLRHNGHELLTFRPEAHLLYLCAHAGIAHGEGQLQLLRYYDIHRMLEVVQPLDWEAVVSQAAAFRWTYVVERALRLAQAYFGTPIPAGVLTALAAQRPADEDTSIVVRRQQPRSRWQRTVDRLGTLSWGQRMGTLFDLLFPPADYMRWRYRIQQRWQLPFYYLYRWLDAAGDVLRGGRTAGPEELQEEVSH